MVEVVVGGVAKCTVGHCRVFDPDQQGVATPLGGEWHLRFTTNWTVTGTPVVQSGKDARCGQHLVLVLPHGKVQVVLVEIGADGVNVLVVETVNFAFFVATGSVG